MSDFQELSDLLQGLFAAGPSAADVDPTELGITLQAFRDRFLSLLDCKGPNPASRQQVESLVVTTPKYGEQRLDAEPDKRLALQLSAALNLDEVLCVQYLLAASEEYGSFTVESAAGVYMKERQAAARCLMQLLAEVAVQVTLPQDTSRHPYGILLHDFVLSLLAERKPPPSGTGKGPQVLLARLIDVLKDTSLEVTMHSDLQEVWDEAGVPVSRTQMLQLERRLVAKCLLYCLIIDQRAAPQVVASLLDLLVSHLTARPRHGLPAASAAFHGELGQLLLLSLSLALTPQEERGTQEKDELLALLASQDVKSKVFPPGSKAPGGAAATPPAGAGTTVAVQATAHMHPHMAGPYAVLRLCWGVLSTTVSTQAMAVEEARKLLSEASGSGTFTHLKQLLGGALFSQDDATHQELVACCVYGLVGQALQADAKLDGPLYRALVERATLCVKRTGGGGLAFSPLPPNDLALRCDHLGSVLALLASVFGLAPRLWLNPDGGYAGGESQRVIELLITRTVTHDAMRVSPELRTPFLQMMTSLAAGEYGTALVLRQFAEMARSPQLEVLTWRKLIATIVEYCMRYNTVLEELSRSSTAGSMPALMLRGHEERLMNAYETSILCAFVTLFKQVVESGTAADIRGFLEALERETAPLLSGYPLTEPLFQLMCHPVPNTVKACLDSALAAIAHRFPETTALRLLDRLMACAVVSPGVAPMPGVPRLDLVTQLNEIEARKEEYPETLAFVHLLNSLVSAALLRDVGPGGSAASGNGLGRQGSGDGGAALSHFTGFVVQHVLAHLWHRGYKYPAQKWEVATVALQHLELMIEVAARSGSVPGGPTDRQAPGWAVMHDILSSGPSMHALMYVLAPGHEEITSSALQPLEGAGGVDDAMGVNVPASASMTHEDLAAAGGTAAPFVAGMLTARQSAVLAALRVLNKALQLDQQFIASTAPLLSGGARYQPLDSLLAQVGGNGGGASGSLALVVLGSGGGARAQASLLVSTLLLYVCYQESEEVQVEAIQLALALAARNPGIVDLLVSGSGGDTGRADGDNGDNARLALRRGMALALRASLANPAAIDHLDDALNAGRGLIPLGVPPTLPASATKASSPQSDPRASLILRLLLASADAPAVPTLTHLLLGYDCEPGLSTVEDTVLSPRAEYSCLSVIERALVAGGCALSTSKPELYAHTLQLLYRMASSGPGSSAMLDYLTPCNVDLLPLMRPVLVAPLPAQDVVLECSSSLHQRSWLLRLMALLLLRLEHTESIRNLLADVLMPAAAAADSSVAGGPAGGALQLCGTAGSVLLHLLGTITSLTVQEPKLSELPPEVRRLQSDMVADDVSVEAILTQPHVQAVLSVHMESTTGDVLFDIQRLFGLLMQRYEQYALRTGQPSGVAGEGALEAIRATLRYAQQHNSASLLSGAQQAAALAWLQLVEVAFTRQYAQVVAVMPDTQAASEALLEVLMCSLQTTLALLAGPSSAGSHALAATLVNVARILLAKLQELGVVNVSLGQASDPLLLVRTSNRCTELLRTLLELVERSRRAQAVRVQLYAALLQYLQFCRGSKMGSCTPAVLQAVLQSQQQQQAPAARQTSVGGLQAVGGPNGTRLSAALVAQLDATQEAIERGNAALVNVQGPMLVEVVARDALDAGGPPLQQAVALHLLAALVGASSSTGVGGLPGAPLSSALPGGGTLLAALFHHAVPQALLQALSNVPQALLVTASRASRRGVLVLQAQLALLLAMVQAGPHAKHSAQALFALQPMQYLVGCRALDMEPEEPGSTAATRLRGPEHMLDSVRYRLQHLIPPVLRLVLGLVAALPESSSVRLEARMFVGAHFRAIDRILREAASTAAGDWAPGEDELEQAELATGLLCRLVPVWQELGPMHAEGLRAALFRVATAFCCLNIKSTSPIVRSLHSATPPASSALVLAPPGALSLPARPGPNGALATHAKAGGGGNNRAALLQRATRVASLRAALARYLRDLVAHAPLPSSKPSPAAQPKGVSVGVPFRCMGTAARPEVDPYECRPTLLLIRDMAEQACLDAGGALEELEDLLVLLRQPDTQLDDRTCVQRLLDYAPPGNAAVGAGAAQGGAAATASALGGGLHARRKLVRHYAALAGSTLDHLLGKALFVLESSLAVIVLHFIRYLPGALPDLTGPSSVLKGAPVSGGAEELLMAAAASSLQDAGAGAQDLSHLLGSPTDLTYLATRLQETCLKAEELLSHASQLGYDGGAWNSAGRVAAAVPVPTLHVERLQGIDLMVRTVKSVISCRL